jgi:hypothetical protein
MYITTPRSEDIHENESERKKTHNNEQAEDCENTWLYMCGLGMYYSLRSEISIDDFILT